MKPDYSAVLAGIAVGLAVAIISRLLLGKDAMVIGGSLIAASISASAVTKTRLQQARRLSSTN